MVRKLKHHESKLLRHHDFVNYKQDNNHRDHDVARRYMIQKPEDYVSFDTRPVLELFNKTVTDPNNSTSTTEYAA